MKLLAQAFSGKDEFFPGTALSKEAVKPVGANQLTRLPCCCCLGITPRAKMLKISAYFTLNGDKTPPAARDSNKVACA